ncbi:MFS transporter [Actinomyces faecalis]|uniref:MFS transporter n=1 Tax=Actinomyces faecalis TaxID=2722820 RepID=UPI001553B25E|nr:MFS transporter [Actinomyces faecalis]
MDKTTPSSVTTDTRADRARSKADKKAARNQHKSETAERKAAIRAERRRLRQLRQRRRLRVDDVTVVEEPALKKAILGSVVGNLMEWYDVGVYGYVAVILGKVFLPDVDGHVQNLFSLGVFAVTFIARPLGGVILGQLGDRLGRKEVLAYTLLMMAAATFLIGVLPTYAAAGVIAPILLICLKLVQGFSTGGEYAGATTFITEYAPDKKRGFYASLLDWGSYMGFAAGAAVVSVLQLTLSEDFMQSWGWRFPFMAALPLGLIALYFRSHIEDTPAFVEAQSSQDEDADEDSAPRSGSVGDVEAAIQATDEGPKGVRALVVAYRRELATAFVLVAAANTVAYALTSYMPTYLTTTLHYDAVHGNLLTLPVLVLLAFSVPVAGWLSDRLGRRAILFSGAAAAVVLAVPAFMLMAHGEVWSTLLGLAMLALPVALYVGNQASSLPALFPTSSRYGAMGIAYNAAVAIFGGTAGFIMEALVAVTGSALAPAFWVIATSVAGFIAVTQMPESARQPLPGSMPSVASQEEAIELVETQEENPDLDVAEMFAQAPVHLLDQEPTAQEARAEVEVALAAEQEVREELARAQRATQAARDAVVAAEQREREQDEERDDAEDEA